MTKQDAEERADKIVNATLSQSWDAEDLRRRVAKALLEAYQRGVEAELAAFGKVMGET